MQHEDRPVEIKDLNKTQLILLAILLSFVVSIATGIVTATLLQQAPPAVTQTINRVVQQTIEKVAPDYVPGQTQTVVVKEDDLVVDAVTKTRSNLLPLLATADAKDSIADAYSVGNGTFITRADAVDQTQKYVIKDGNNPINLKVRTVYANGLAVLITDSADQIVKDFPASVFGKDSDVNAGSTVIVVNQNSVIKDTVQNVTPHEQKDSTGVVTDKWNTFGIPDTLSSTLVGSPVADLDGSVIGFASLDSSNKFQILGIDEIGKMIRGEVTTGGAAVNPLPAAAVDSLKP